MNTAIRLFADAANAKTKQENGFDLTEYDDRALKFAFDYTDKLLAIDENLAINDMLDTGWDLFATHFSKSEVGIRENLLEKYWPDGIENEKVNINTESNS